MELFGFDAALETVSHRGRQEQGLACLEENSSGLRKSGDTFERLRKAMLQEWRRASELERSADEVPQNGIGKVPVAGVLLVNKDTDGQENQGATAPPSPSDILTASSIRMMLSMATTFRRSDPTVLGAMCETLLEVLLETSQLALAPLNHDQTSIAASTFRRVSNFCAELMGSPNPSEIQHALGLYLALAISRGAVSGLLEVVRCLLDRCEPDVPGRQAVGESNELAAFAHAAVSTAAGAMSPRSAVSPTVRETAPMGETNEFADGHRRDQQAKLSVVLGRLAEHHINVELPVPDERDDIVVVAKIPNRLTRIVAHVQEEIDAVEWNHPVSAATDGKFVYAWHPDIGLTKVGTGLRGTTKGRLYAQNSGAGRLDPGCPLTVTAPPAGVRIRAAFGSIGMVADLAVRAGDQDRIRVERAGDVRGWTPDEAVGSACTDGTQQRRLLVHYTWRGLHDLESFSEEQPVELPTVRAHQSWAGRSADMRLESTGEEPPAPLRVISAACVTFGQALWVLSRLRGDDGKTLRLLPGSLRRVVGQYLLTDLTSVPGDRRGGRKGFVVAMGNRVYLQARGCMPSHRFLTLRASDLAVDGIVDAPSLMLPHSAVSPSVLEATGGRSNGSPLQTDGEIKAEYAEWEEKVGDDAVGARVGSKQENAESTAAPFVPLCFDGRLVYALLPSLATGRPAVAVVDPANGFRAAHPIIDLHRPAMMPDTMMQTSSKSYDDGNGLTNSEEWPWWKGRAAMPEVRTYCNGDYFVVCWIRDTDAAGANRPSRLSDVRQSEARLGLRADPVESANTTVFRLSTGECESNRCGAAQFQRIPLFVGNDSSNDVISRCSLRRQMEPDESSCAAELVVLLSQKSKAGHDPSLDGPLTWGGMLHSLRVGKHNGPVHCTKNIQQPLDGTNYTASRGDTSDREPGHGISALSAIAVFVLAHLDRMAAQHVDSREGKTRAQGLGSALSNDGILSAPFCYDLSPATFEHLVGLVKTFSTEPASLQEHGAIITSQEQLRLYVLCSSLRLLRVNVGVLLNRGMGVEEFGGDTLRQSLLLCLLALAERHPRDFSRPERATSDGSVLTAGSDRGREASAMEALRLVVEGMDLFYPTRRRQARLLVTYLHAYTSREAPLPVGARMMILELLARISSMQFLHEIEATEGASKDVAADAPERVVLMEDTGPGLPSGDRFLLGPDVLDGLSSALLDLATVRSIQRVQVAASEIDGARTAVSLVKKGGEDLVEGAVLGALVCVLELRSAEASRVNQPTANDGDRVEGDATPLLKFLLLVLRAADRTLGAASTTTSAREQWAPPIQAQAVSSFSAIRRALHQGLVGTVLPPVLVASWALLDEIGTEGLVWSRKGVLEAYLCLLQEPLVGVVGKLGMFATASSNVGLEWGVETVLQSAVGTSPTTEGEPEGSCDRDGARQDTVASSDLESSEVSRGLFVCKRAVKSRLTIIFHCTAFFVKSFSQCFPEQSAKSVTLSALFHSRAAQWEIGLDFCKVGKCER